MIRSFSAAAAPAASTSPTPKPSSLSSSPRSCLSLLKSLTMINFIIIFIFFFFFFFCLTASPFSAPASARPILGRALAALGDGDAAAATTPASARAADDDGSKQEWPTYVYAFGDSTTDSGNSPVSDPKHNRVVLGLPYGVTWFHRGSGRRSDGRLILDYLCLQAFGYGATSELPKPHLLVSQNSSSSSTSVESAEPESGLAASSQNYAVAGSTAVDPETLDREEGLEASTPYSLERQADWFEADAASWSSSSWSSGESISRGTSVIYFGETGGNDLHFAFRTHLAKENIREDLMPMIISAMAEQLDRILSVDVRPAPITRAVIQGQFPIGCLPAYVQKASSEPDSELDQFGCIASVNAISDMQNELIRSSVIPAIAAKHPDVAIVFLDSSAAYRHVLAHAPEFGFNSSLYDEPCYDTANHTVCSDPSVYMSWDGVHLTDALHGALTRLFLHGLPDGSKSFSEPFPSFLTELALKSTHGSSPGVAANGS